MKFTPQILWEAEGAAGEGGTAAVQGGSLYAPAQTVTEGSPENLQPGDREIIQSGYDGPDWVYEQFRSAENPIEAQAKSYAEALKKINTKTDTLREELRNDEAFRKEIAESLRDPKAPKAPESWEDYKYPDDYQAPDGELDKTFREWAQKSGVSQEGFNELLNIYKSTMPDPQVELQKLGENAGTRIAEMNAWGSKHIPVELQDAASQIMQTAEGFELVEHLMNLSRSSISPDGLAPAAPLSKEAIMEAQNDPRYWDDTKRDMGYVRRVDEMWQNYFKRGGV